LVDELREVSESFSKNNYTHCRALYIGLFVVTSLISVLIFFAETSTFVAPFRYVNVLGLINFASPASFALNCFLMAYIVYMATHTVFRIKLNRVYALHKKHSGASSLTFTATNLARVCYPLCFNYLQLTHIGSAAFISFFGTVTTDFQFAFVFPIIMIVFAFFNLIDVYGTIVGYLGLTSFALDEEDAREQAEEGQRILVERLKERNACNNKTEMVQLL
jgi:hypothetical protein